jgi:hypothetical protein
MKLIFYDNQTIEHYIVQGLFLFGKARHDEADSERDGTYDLTEMSTRCPVKTNSFSLRVGHYYPERFFPYGGLILRAFHK